MIKIDAKKRSRFLAWNRNVFAGELCYIPDSPLAKTDGLTCVGVGLHLILIEPLTNGGREQSYCRTWISESALWWEYDRVYLFSTLKMSFIKMLNRRGPSIEPCGTPLLV